MYLLSPEDDLLFAGTRRECKLYIRKNKVKNYKIREYFTPIKQPLDFDFDFEFDEDE